MKDVKGISPKILAQELKHLEQNELVVRNVFPSTPVSIVYEASAYSETLRDVLSTLSEWEPDTERRSQVGSDVTRP